MLRFDFKLQDPHSKQKKIAAWNNLPMEGCGCDVLTFFDLGHKMWNMSGLEQGSVPHLVQSTFLQLAH